MTVILDQHEDELQNYKETKDILDLNREENLYFTEMMKYDEQARGASSSQIQSLDALEDYVLQQRGRRAAAAGHLHHRGRFPEETP